MPHSHHSHSGEFCRHAAGRLEDIVKEAISQRFTLFGLSEHCPRYREMDLYPEEKDLSVQQLRESFDLYVDEAHRLRSKYASDITLLVGLETDLITNLDLDGLRLLLDHHGDRIEYIIGSVHHVNTIPIDFDQATFEKALSSCQLQNTDDQDRDAMASFLTSYFNSQHQLMSRFHPEIIGHFDLCRLYKPTLRLTDYPKAWEAVERNVKFAIGYGALFELNAAAFRKGWNEAYPAEDVLKLILREGGRFALSDDSHGPHAVGLNYQKLYAYMRRVGIEELWHLARSEERNAGGRKVEVRRVSGNWWEDEFWSDKRGE